MGLTTLGRKSRVAVSCLAVAALVSLAACGEVTTDATGGTGTTGSSAAASEFAVTEGNYAEYEIDMNSGGSIEFDITLPESGRGDDWDKAAILELYENVYRGGQDGYASVLPYKLKTCDAKNCYEPRYNLAWDQWRHVKYEWTATGATADIDGTQVSVTFKGGGFGSPPVKLVYGNKPGGPLLAGATMKNIVIKGSTKQLH